MTHFTVFEHEALRVGEKGFTETHRKALEDYHGEGCPYFSLIHRGVKFNEYVGVLQAGNFSVEVLPKADKDASGNEALWQAFLLTMLRAAGLLPEATSTASLRLQPYSILELYMALFLGEVRYLVQTGLVRQYRKTEGNSSALKGSLQFAAHLRHNLTHAERFYVRHTTYDRDHLHNALLRQTLELIAKIALSPTISGEANALLLDFPETKAVPISESLFQKLSYCRKTEGYRTAHAIARLLLLSYHPDIRCGQNDVLALMFNANLLWEKYILKLLRRALNRQHPGKYLLREQVRTDFWQPAGGPMQRVAPDIVMYEAANPQKALLVLDTKWKRLLPANRPADDDLKQMLIYNLYQGCGHSALVYPSTGPRKSVVGQYQSAHGTECSLQFVPVVEGENGLYAAIEPLLQLILGRHRQAAEKIA